MISTEIFELDQKYCLAPEFLFEADKCYKLLIKNLLSLLSIFSDEKKINSPNNEIINYKKSLSCSQNIMDQCYQF